jgi:hypothetical protein
MSNAKKLKEAAELSANDVLAKKFCQLRDRIAKDTKELKALKKQWGHGSSFNTRHYMVLVKHSKSVKVPNMAEGIAYFGKAFLKACGETSKTTVTVEKKGE